MDENLKSSMLAYYDARAVEYDEVYDLGTGSASITDREMIRAEAKSLASVISSFGQGAFIDIACGSGYWLPHYHSRCSSITAFDQAPQMLAQFKKRAASLGIEAQCRFVCGDILDAALGDALYDSALVGFLLSHVTEKQEQTIFSKLRRALKQDGSFLILDSAWTHERQKANSRTEYQKRYLNDGSQYTIFKKYFDRADIAGWASRHRFMVNVEYFGKVFFAVGGVFE